MFEQSNQYEKSVLSGRTGLKKKSAPDTELFLKQLKNQMSGNIQLFAEDEEGGKVQREAQKDENQQMKSASAKVTGSGEESTYAKASVDEEEQIQPAYAKASAGSINSDASLEKEADEMGTKAAQGRMVNEKGSRNGVQRKKEEKEKEKWTITRYITEGHKGGYQHIFDEEGKLVILIPVHGPHSFHITTLPESYESKGDGALVGVGEIKQVNIHDVFYGLYMFYHSRPELEHPFVNHIYKYNKEDGYDYVQYRSIRGINQAHKDFFNNGGWMMFAVAAIPFAIEAIPFIIQTSPHLITKIPKPLLIKALKKVGKSFLIKSGENIIDGLISYIFTGDFDLVSMGLNYTPGMLKSKKIKLLFKGLLLIVDASVDYNFNEQQLKVIVENKSTENAVIDLVFTAFGKITNDAVNKEFSSNIAKLLLRGQSNTLFTGTSNALKNGTDEPSND